MKSKELQLSDQGIFFDNESFYFLKLFLSSAKFSKVFVLGDENSLQHCYPIIASEVELLQSAEIIESESGEINKSIETCIQLWGALTDLGADKESLLINVGGGVIGDLGGFVASTYKRGIAFINIPTTLLAMVDASVGGKNGIDFDSVKNHIGTIVQPDAVIINPVFLNTLPDRHIKNGMAEIIKMGIVRDKSMLNKIAAQKISIEECIYRSVQLKNSIVQKDPFDKGIRRILNFGHTIGHAIESIYLTTKTEVLHGEAIALGMLMESIIALELKMITKAELEQIIDFILPNYKAFKFSEKQKIAIMKLIKQDKKMKDGQIMMSLPKGLGKAAFNIAVETKFIERAFLNYHQIIARK